MIKEKLISINGIGSVLADKLIDAGLTKISELTTKKYWSMLPLETQIFIKKKPLTKIPRSFIERVEKKILKLLSGIDATIAGSYRRGKDFSGDIDLIVVKSDMGDILKKLKPLELDVFSEGSAKVSAIIKVFGKRVKLDIFRTSKKEKYAMILYGTGSKNFNH